MLQVFWALIFLVKSKKCYFAILVLFISIMTKIIRTFNAIHYTEAKRSILIITLKKAFEIEL